MYKSKYKKFYFNKNKVFIIAEAGINHNGSLKNAYKLIDSAAEAGCDAIKFQTFDVDTMVHKSAELANYQKKYEKNNQKTMLKKYQLSFANFIKIKKYSEKKKIIFLSTPFDLKSANFLKNKIPIFKISSGDNDNFILIDHIKKFNKPIILSLGMLNDREVKKIIKNLKINKKKLFLLHCISEYPTDLSKTQMGYIKTLIKRGFNVGFSDHTIGFEASIVAICFGAKIIEKHITLKNNMKGPDHKASLNVKDLKKFVNTLRIIEKLNKFNNKFITIEENNTKKIAKKSLFLKRKINRFNVLKSSDLIPMRPLKNGISAMNYKKILGKKVRYKKNKFDQLHYKDLI